MPPLEKHPPSEQKKLKRALGRSIMDLPHILKELGELKGVDTTVLQRLVTGLRTDVNGLNSRMTAQEAAVVNLSTDVSDVKDLVQGLGGRVYRLNDDVAAQGQVLTSLTTQVSTLRNDSAVMVNDLAALNNRSRQQGSSIQNLEVLLAGLSERVSLLQAGDVGAVSAAIGSLTDLVTAHINNEGNPHNVTDVQIQSSVSYADIFIQNLT